MTETKIYDTEYNVSAIGVPTFPGKLVIWLSYFNETPKKKKESQVMKDILLVLTHLTNPFLTQLEIN